MHELSVSAETVEYIRVPVAAREEGEVLDPTSLPVRMAFVRSGKPGNGDWAAAEWEADGERFYARTLLNAATLGRGSYGVWVEITAATEKPVREVGRMRID